MVEHLAGRRGGILRDVAPTAIVVVSIRELNRACPVLASGVDIGSTREQFVDQIELPGHHGPVDRLIGTLIAEVQEFGRGIEQRTYTGQVTVADGPGDHLTPGRYAVEVLEP